MPGTEIVRSIIQNIVKSSGFGQCMKNVNILSAGNGHCKAQFTVSDEHLNLGGTLHGGFISTIMDCVSTYALVTHKNVNPGVSVDLHVTFMKAALPGELVTVDARTIRAGKTLAFLAINLTKNDGKDVVAQGQHTKFVGQR